MVFSRQVNFFSIPRPAIAAILFLLLIASSCTVPRRYQKGKPFVYKSDVTLSSELPTAQRQQLKQGLINQIDDSLQVKTVLAVRPVPPFFYHRLSRPPVFDSLYIGRSRTFMTALLNTQGYFSPVIADTFSIDTVKGQQRVSVRFFVTPGKALRLDSVGYDLRTPELQQLALQYRNRSLLQKNTPYSIQQISNELDRLLGIYRDNGYFKLSREDLYVEHDTVVAALIDPSLGLFEQIELLDSLRRKKENPSVSIVFKERTPKDSTHLEKYTWGNIIVYPDRPFLPPSPAPRPDTLRVGKYQFLSFSERFKLPFVARNISIRPGELYRQSDYFKTINTFTNLGAWQQVDIDLSERGDSVAHILDAVISLYPAKKQSLNIDFETSRNTSDVLTTGSLFGIGLNLGIRNRNAFRESISTSSNLRFGVELGTDIVQTLQTSFSHNIYVPRFITPFRIKNEKNLTAPRTIINFNTEYTNRRLFFEVWSAKTSWGYDWTKKNHNWQYIPFNFEYSKVNKTDSLIRLEKRFPSIAQAFNNGLIIGQVLSYAKGNLTEKNPRFFRARLEESGAIFGFFKGLERGELRRFVKLDLEYKYFIENPKSTWAFRMFGGYGYVYGKTGDQPENNLPFFKAYFGGGPYSMRAWAVRRLGLGSTAAFDTTSNTDRFGDMQLEGNVEYRFDLGRLFGIKLKSAFFADIGNIWGRSFDGNTNTRIDSAEFKLSRLYTDLAVGAGTSLRFDFDFFLIRLDWAYKIKNPVYARENDGWFHKLQLGSGQFQLGIGYPF